MNKGVLTLYIIYFIKLTIIHNKSNKRATESVLHIPVQFTM